MKEVTVQITVEVGIEPAWNAMTRDLSSTALKIIPNIAKNCQILQGNGGLGTVFLVEFGAEKASLVYQKEKVVVFDESLHVFGLQVIEGGHLNHGFSSYTTVFQFTATGESHTNSTIVDIKVLYEIEEDNNHAKPEETIKASLGFIKCLEEHLLKEDTSK